MLSLFSLSSSVLTPFSRSRFLFSLPRHVRLHLLYQMHCLLRFIPLSSTFDFFHANDKTVVKVSTYGALIIFVKQRLQMQYKNKALSKYYFTSPNTNKQYLLLSLYFSDSIACLYLHNTLPYHCVIAVNHQRETWVYEQCPIVQSKQNFW